MTPAARTFGRWATAAVWATLPLLAGPILAHALDPRSALFQRSASLGLWIVWGAGLVAALVPSTVALTALRILAPASLTAVIWAVLASSDRADTAASVALAVTSLVTVIALSSFVGDRFVNGSSYGDERRLPLRAPAPLLFGPLELAWLVAVGGIVGGPLLLAARQWLPGLILVVVGWPAAAIAIRALHGLSRRWIVFVPAGLVVVDQMVLADALLVMRQRVAGLEIVDMEVAAENDTDLTAGALGPRLRIALSTPELIVPAVRRRSTPTEPFEVSAVRTAPSRPGWVLAEARSRRLVV